MARTGICGTDLHIRAWDASAQSMVTPPVVLGHEIAGHVEAIGPGVDSINVGDLVSVEGHIVCGRCRNCRAGRRQLCPNTKGVGVHRDGGFAESSSVPAGNVWRHRADLDVEVAAIFDPFGNAVHSALSFPVLGEDVLVTGAGPIGIMAALGGAACRRPPCRGHRHQRVPARAGPQERRDRGGQPNRARPAATS